MRALDHAILIVAAMTVLVGFIACQEPRSPAAGALPPELDDSSAPAPDQPVAAAAPPLTAAQRLSALPPDVPDPVNQSDQPPPTRAAEALAEARRLTAEGQTVQAIRAYERADRFAPSHPVIQRELGLACYDTNHPGRAMAHLLRAAETNPDDSQMQVVLARLYQGDDQTDAALRASRTALKCTDAAGDNALSAEALFRLAELLEATGQRQAAADALDILADWLARYGQTYTDPRARLDVSVPTDLAVPRARLALGLAQPDRAIAIYRDAGLLDVPLQAEELNVLVMALAAAGRVDEAANRLAGGDDSPGAAAQVLMAYAAAGRLADGAAWIAGWIGDRPGQGDRLGRILEAIAFQLPAADVRDAERVDSADAPPYAVHYVRACLVAGRGDRDAAHDELTQAAAINPSFLPVQQRLAESYLARGHAAQADAIAEALPDNQGAELLRTYLRGRIELAQSNLDAAVEALTQAVTDRPDHPPSVLALAEALDRNGQADQAQTALQHHIRQNDMPERIVLRTALEGVHRDADQVDTFVRGVLEDQLHARPGEMDSLAVELTYAEGLWLIGDVDAAAELTNNLARRHPDVMEVQLLAAQTDLLIEIAGAEDAAVDEAETDADDQDAAILARFVWAYFVHQSTLSPGQFRIHLLPRAERATEQTLADALAALRALDRRWPERAQIGRTTCDVLVALDRHDEALRLWQALIARQPNDPAALWGCAVALSQAGHAAQAADIIARISDAYPKDPFLCEAALAPLVQTERYDRAIEWTQAWLARNQAAADPISARPIQARLVALYQLAGHYDQCHRLLDEMLADTRDPGERLNLIIQKLAAFVDAGDGQAARELYRRTSPDTGETPFAREVLIMLLIESHQVDVALGVLDDLLAAETGNAERRHDLRSRKVTVCVTAEQYDRALNMLDEWTADPADPYYSAYQALRINVFAGAGRLDDAVAQFEGSTDRLVRQNLIVNLMEVERFDDVRQLGAAWARRDPTDQPLLRFCVGYLQMTEQDDLALALLGDWDEALAVAPDAEPAPTLTADPVVLARRYVRDARALMLILADRLDEAAQLAERCVDEDPNSVPQRLRYATALDQQERFDEAAQQLAVAADAVRDETYLTDALPPERRESGSVLPSRAEELARRLQLKASVLNNLGYLYAEQGVRLDEAEEMVVESLRIEENVNTLDSLAWVHYKRGRFDKAEHVFTRALAGSRNEADAGLAPEHPLIYDHAGDNLYRLGETDQAVAMWRRAMELVETAEPSRDVESIQTNTPAKLAAAESGQTPPVAPLGEGVADPLNPTPETAHPIQE